MKNGIEDNKYYKLLDWKDRNLDTFTKIVGDCRLCDLNPKDLMDLYKKVISEPTTKVDASDDKFAIYGVSGSKSKKLFTKTFGANSDDADYSGC